MKLMIKCLIFVFLLSPMSCRDSKEEEAQNEAVLEEIEAVETTVEEGSEELDQNVEELEDALEELDSI